MSADATQGDNFLPVTARLKHISKYIKNIYFPERLCYIYQRFTFLLQYKLLISEGFPVLPQMTDQTRNGW